MAASPRKAPLVGVLVLSFLAMALSASASHSWLTLVEGSHTATLPLLSVPSGRDRGFDLGFAIGQTFASQIKQGMALDKDYANAYKWVHANPAPFQNLIARITAAFPEYVEEIKGTAKGAGVNFTDLLILNVRSDIVLSVFPSAPHEEQCSDVLSLIDGGATFIHGHNEDGNGYYKDKGLAYLVQTSSYLGYHYPGQIAGRAFGVNKHGLSFGMNSLEPVMTNLEHGIGMSFVLRSLYEAVDLNDAFARLNAYPVVRGFSANVASLHETACFNLEMAADGFSIKRLNKNLNPLSPVLPHFNAYIHLNAEQRPSPSSVNRLARYEELKPKTLTDILNFLGDTQNTKYPVYRGSSTLATIVTAFSDGSNNDQLVSIYFDNPKNQKPVYVFTFSNATNTV